MSEDPLEMEQCLQRLERAISERDRQEIALRLASPKRPGHVNAADVNDTPLFIAANEERLL